MKKMTFRKEIVAYGDDALHVLGYITEGVSSSEPPVSADVLIDFVKLRKLKISLKKQSGQVFLKCKVKYLVDDSDGAVRDVITSRNRDMPGFKALKKRMDKSFKMIGERLENGGLPSNIEVELFCSNAQRMTTFAGYGDSMYPEFIQVIHEFQEAFHRSDLDECLSLYARISAIKKSCHHNG